MVVIKYRLRGDSRMNYKMLEKSNLIKSFVSTLSSQWSITGKLRRRGLADWYQVIQL